MPRMQRQSVPYIENWASLLIRFGPLSRLHQIPYLMKTTYRRQIRTITRELLVRILARSWALLRRLCFPDLAFGDLTTP